MTFSLRPLALTLLLSLGLALGGCGSSQKDDSMDTDAAVESMDQDEKNFEVNADSDSSTAGTLETVNFDFNSAKLTSSARSALQNNANFLKENSDVEVQIEGHCDERGGVQYNLALGERRAKSVRDYLVAMGISSARLSTISFGKERPLAFGHNEAAWSQNRRANFVITDM
jgi:peptidoglycan-associated lipoprotein